MACHPLLFLLKRLENQQALAAACALALKSSDWQISPFDGTQVVLESAVQWLCDENNREYRIPSFRFTMKPEDIFHWQAFGLTEIVYPGGGCQKNGQSQLPVTFRAPHAWRKIKAQVL